MAILSTGDELVPHGQRPGPGQLVNSNQPLLIVRLRELGAEPLPLGIASDQMPALLQSLVNYLGDPWFAYQIALVAAAYAPFRS